MEKNKNKLSYQEQFGKYFIFLIKLFFKKNVMKNMMICNFV